MAFQNIIRRSMTLLAAAMVSALPSVSFAQDSESLDLSGEIEALLTFRTEQTEVKIEQCALEIFTRYSRPCGDVPAGAK
ncbi:hypothetical protein M3P21_09685 [Ruegeria sp. 2012CJ41-6]|uniref:UrcA family protein n=1 Tax=Ruegeria spongiae TaxID=2942209 RepID=A0ABT0Q3Q4_9RHOB|nr:hypothetical protein [Ruegeria spongiae]MCL6283798.1 hypothetical protein [Ruegeria spongiae]